MFLGIEFYANSVIGVSTGTFFKTKVLVDNGEKVEFAGCDFFDLNSVILKDNRVSASGRNCTTSLANLSAGLGTLNISGTKSVFLEIDNHEKIQLQLETNLFKDLEFVKQKISIKLISSDFITPLIPLNSIWFNIKHQENKILVDITNLIQEFRLKKDRQASL